MKVQRVYWKVLEYRERPDGIDQSAVIACAECHEAICATCWKCHQCQTGKCETCDLPPELVARLLTGTKP